MEGRIKSLSYQLNGKLTNAEQEGRYFCFPAKALQFISMGSGRDIVLHGSVCMQMQCSVGIIHMPESLAIFTCFTCETEIISCYFLSNFYHLQIIASNNG